MSHDFTIDMSCDEELVFPTPEEIKDQGWKTIGTIEYDDVTQTIQPDPTSPSTVKLRIPKRRHSAGYTCRVCHEVVSILIYSEDSQACFDCILYADSLGDKTDSAIPPSATDSNVNPTSTSVSGSSRNPVHQSRVAEVSREPSDT
jgi:hypothetical protein